MKNKILTELVLATALFVASPSNDNLAYAGGASAAGSTLILSKAQQEQRQNTNYNDVGAMMAVFGTISSAILLGLGATYLLGRKK